MASVHLFQPFSHLLLFFSCCFSVIPFSLSEIKNIEIVSDARPVILFEQFGYWAGGGAAVSIKGVSWKPPPFQKSRQGNTSLMGFFLIEAILYSRILNESEQSFNFCPISSHFVIPILGFHDLNSDGTCSKSVVVKNSDEYSLLFGNCNAGFQVTMEVRTEMYNVGHGFGREKDYLPAGKTRLPTIFFAFSLVYLGFLAVWIIACLKQRATAHKIHAVMAALLLFKALKLVCASEDAWYVSKTGTPHGWDVAFYVFGILKGILLFTVIVLIGTGWFFLKPYLQDREKDVLMLVIPLQVVENIAAIVIGETGPAEADWIKWNQLFLVVDIICCCAVFAPILWSIRSLREASRTDGKAARNLQKLTLFKQFYMVVVCYLYSTRILLPAAAALLSYQYVWCIDAAMEGGSLAFYLFVFVNFRPVERNPYLFIGDEEEAAAAEALEMDDFNDF